MNSVVSDFGRLDIDIANAGICTEVDALDLTPKQSQELMVVNLGGAFYTAKAAAKVFKAQDSGNIVFTISMSAIIVNRPGSQTAVSRSFVNSFLNRYAKIGLNHNASKAGLVQLVKSLAIEWVGFAG